MGIDFSKIIKYFISRGKRDKQFEVLRDWKILMFCFVILFIAASLWGGYVFWTRLKIFEQDGNVVGSMIQKKMLTVNRDVLNGVLEDISKKEAETERILSNHIDIKDPSL